MTVRTWFLDTSGRPATAAHAPRDDTPGTTSTLWEPESLANMYMNDP